MTDKKCHDNDLWLDDDTPSPEACQSYRNLHRVVAVDYDNDIRVQVYATGDKETVEKL